MSSLPAIYVLKGVAILIKNQFMAYFSVMPESNPENE